MKTSLLNIYLLSLCKLLTFVVHWQHRTSMQSFLILVWRRQVQLVTGLMCQLRLWVLMAMLLLNMLPQVCLIFIVTRTKSFILLYTIINPQYLSLSMLLLIKLNYVREDRCSTLHLSLKKTSVKFGTRI